MQLRRSQLYELAWTVPKEFIAATVGVSGSAVGKTCRKYQIPVPGRGDWQKLRKGQSIHRPPLPEPEKDRVVPVEIEESRYLELTQGAAATHMRELQTAEPDAATIVTETRQSTEHTATSQPKAGLQPEARPREVTARPTGQDPYRWLQAYEANGRLTALIPRRRGRQPGQTYLSEAQEALIAAAIADHYTGKRGSMQAVFVAVEIACRKSGIRLPTPLAVRARISADAGDGRHSARFGAGGPELHA